MAKDGGQAFPFVPTDYGGFQDGMSLRDYFAAAALQGMIASSPVVDRTDSKAINKPRWAKQAYSFADAMLAERDKK